MAYSPTPLRGRIKWASLLDIPVIDADVLALALNTCISAGSTLDDPRFYAKTDDDGEGLVILRLRHLLSLGLDGFIAGTSHVFESGTWRRFTKAWLTETLDRYEKFVQESIGILSGVELAPYDVPPGGIKINGVKHEGEDAYIALHPPSFKGHAFTIHHKNYPAWARDIKLEACDLCCDGKYLIFLKRGQGFGQVVDVCGQAKQTAKYLGEVELFRNWAQAQVITPAKWTTDLNDRPKITFVVALIVNDAASAKAAMGARSKDCILDFHDTVYRTYGFRAAFCYVETA
jgi:hypothetical protein